jgi:hypothetical protein
MFMSWFPELEKWEIVLARRRSDAGKLSLRLPYAVQVTIALKSEISKTRSNTGIMTPERATG